MSNNNVTVVIDENVPGRNLAMSVFLFPMLLLVSTFIGVPFVFFNIFNIAAAVLTTIAAEMLVIFIALRYTKNVPEWKNVLRLSNFTFKNFSIGIGVGAAMWFTLQAVSILLDNVGIDLSSSNTSTSLASVDGFWRYAIYYLCVPFIVPFVEELFFRGAIIGFTQRGISNEKKGKIIAVVISSVAFGFAHLQGFSTFTDLFIVVWTGLIGLINAILVLKYDSIYPAYAMHLTYNGITVLLSAYIS